MFVVVACTAENGVIGAKGGIPWHLPLDLKFFQKITSQQETPFFSNLNDGTNFSGSCVIMGRKTWESIPEKYRPLRNRLNIIVTRNPEYTVTPCNPMVLVCHNLRDAIKRAEDLRKRVFIVGGGAIYQEALELKQEMPITCFVTKVFANHKITGDAFFPLLDMLESCQSKCAWSSPKCITSKVVKWLTESENAENSPTINNSELIQINADFKIGFYLYEMK